MTKEERDKLADQLRRAADARMFAARGNVMEEGKAKGLMLAAAMVARIRPERSKDETD